jgi:septal ring factor EnvC (AmiA/AmiB activator)
MIEDTPRTDAYFKSWQDSWSSAPITLDLCKELERELNAIASKYDRLNESIPKNKRLFANEFAKEIIASQTKRIKQLEDELIELKHSIRKNKL